MLGSINKIYNVGIYIRLSREDDDKVMMSESITNQKSLLLQYVKENNLRVYDIFNQLVVSLFECNLPYEVRDKNMLRRTSNYDKLVHDDMIKWSCDDYNEDVGPSFKIEKVDDEFVVTFDRGIIEKQFLASKYSISVRIRNSGSLYQPFNANFMRLSPS